MYVWCISFFLVLCALVTAAPPLAVRYARLSRRLVWSSWLWNFVLPFTVLLVYPLREAIDWNGVREDLCVVVVTRALTSPGIDISSALGSLQPGASGLSGLESLQTAVQEQLSQAFGSKLSARLVSHRLGPRLWDTSLATVGPMTCEGRLAESRDERPLALPGCEDERRSRADVVSRAGHGLADDLLRESHALRLEGRPALPGRSLLWSSCCRADELSNTLLRICQELPKGSGCVLHSVHGNRVRRVSGLPAKLLKLQCHKCAGLDGLGYSQRVYGFGSTAASNLQYDGGPAILQIPRSMQFCYSRREQRGLYRWHLGGFSIHAHVHIDFIWRFTL